MERVECVYRKRREQMTIEAQVNLLIGFHGKQGAFDYARFHALNDRKNDSRKYWLEVLEYIRNMVD